MDDDRHGTTRPWARQPKLPDEIRTNPGAHVGVDDSGGVLQLITQLLDTAVARHIAGEVSAIDVRVHADHFSISDDGPGLSRRQLSPALTQSSDSRHPLGQHELGLAMVNSLARRFEVISCRHGAERRWLFESFEPIVSGERLGPATRAGTTIRVWPDPTVFCSTEPDMSALEARMAALHRVRASLRLRLDGQPLSGASGPRAWVRQQCATLGAPTVHSIEAHRGTTRLELAFAWLRPFGSARCLSYVNLAETLGDGSHVDGLLDALASIHGTSRLMAKERCLAMISVIAHRPRLSAAAPTQLDDSELYRWVRGLVRREVG